MHPARQARMVLVNKCVKLAAIDEHGNRVIKNGGPRVGSGFLMRHDTGLHLYTCWHVVTGLDWRDPVLPAAGEQRTLFVDMIFQDASPEGATLEGIGGSRTVRLRLYESPEVPWRPLWQQSRVSRSCPNIEMAGLRAPRLHDVVRLQVPEDGLFVSETLQVFAEGEIWRDLVATGDMLRVLGFPYGFRGSDRHEQGLMLTRFATQMGFSEQLDGAFLDSPCAPGMSGGPVLIEMGGHVFIPGIYTGSRYPDGERAEKTTALGTFCPLTQLLCGSSEEFECYAVSET